MLRNGCSSSLNTSFIFLTGEHFFLLHVLILPSAKTCSYINFRTQTPSLNLCHQPNLGSRVEHAILHGFLFYSIHPQHFFQNICILGCLDKQGQTESCKLTKFLFPSRRQHLDSAESVAGVMFPCQNREKVHTQQFCSRKRWTFGFPNGQSKLKFSPSPEVLWWAQTVLTTHCFCTRGSFFNKICNFS